MAGVRGVRAEPLNSEPLVIKMSRIVHISNFLGLTRSTVGVLFMVILVGLGERLAERFLPMYLLALGGGAISIGLLNGMDNVLSGLSAFPGG